MKNHQNLSDGPLLPTLLKFTFPILLSILLQTTYGTVDLLVVGQFASVADVSGVTIGSQIMVTITSFCTGLSMGTTILLGQYIGSRQKEKTSKTVGVSLFLFSLLAVIITLGILILNDQIIALMKTPTESMTQTKSYLTFCGMGAVFIVSYNLLGSIFRGIGDSKTPLIAVAIACVVNIVMDLILVAVLGMGASGAALATTIAQATSVVLSICMIRKQTLPFTFVKETISFDFFYVKRIITLGLPIALQSVLVSVSFLFVTSIINVFGVTASAAVGIVEKITGLVMIVPQAFMQSLSAFTAQNIGAGKWKRASKGLRYGITFSLVFGVVTTYLSAFHGTIFTQIFTSDPQITESALLYLKSYSIDIMLVAIMFSMTGYFNGCGKTAFVMIQCVFGAFCIRIPLAYFFSTLEHTSLFIIGLATPSSTIFQVILCMVYYRHCQKKFRTLGHC